MRSRRYTETPDFLAALRRMIRSAGKRVGESDTEDLAALIAIRADLDDVIARAVVELRNSGVTWQSIGDATGTSRQAAIQKWHRFERLEQGA